MREPPREPVPFFYHVGNRLTILLLDLFSRWRIIGRERVPLRGSLLVVCNHLNNADPIIMQAVMPRVIHVMAKEELFHGIVGWMARGMSSFPVRRGHADRQAIRTALDYLAKGSCVGIFPEGTRSKTGGLIPGQPGAGLLALRSGATIQPVAVVGTSVLRHPVDALRRPRIDIIFGEPFNLSRSTNPGRGTSAAEATDEIMLRIAALLPPELRGHYRDRLAAEAVRA